MIDVSGVGLARISPEEVLRLRDEVHQTAVEKGWWPSAGLQEMSCDDLDEKIFLVVTELSEAFEIYRSREDLLKVWEGEGGKPEGFSIEMADAYIRILDLAGALQVRPEFHAFKDDIASERSFSGLMMEITKALSKVSRVAQERGFRSYSFLAAISASLHLVELVCLQVGIDLAEAIKTKAAYNKTRPYRHGNKKA